MAYWWTVSRSSTRCLIATTFSTVQRIMNSSCYLLLHRSDEVLTDRCKHGLRERA